MKTDQKKPAQGIRGQSDDAAGVGMRISAATWRRGANWYVFSLFFLTFLYLNERQIIF
jgi:hypothetical protein